MLNLENKAQVLEEVLSEVFESFVFLFCDPAAKEELQANQLDGYVIEMGFRGPITGKLRFMAERSLCPEITANILGFEVNSDFVTNNLEDALKELLNIMGAHVLSRLAGEGSNFMMEIPTSHPSQPQDWQTALQDPNTVVLVAEGRPILMGVDILKVNG